MIQNTRNVGIAVAVLGLLLSCCLCPLALNSLLIIGGRPGFYGQLFSQRVGRLIASSYVVGAQSVCATLLALVTLIIGIVLLVQSRGNDKPS